MGCRSSSSGGSACRYVLASASRSLAAVGRRSSLHLCACRPCTTHSNSAAIPSSRRASRSHHGRARVAVQRRCLEDRPTKTHLRDASLVQTCTQASSPHHPARVANAAPMPLACCLPCRALLGRRSHTARVPVGRRSGAACARHAVPCRNDCKPPRRCPNQRSNVIVARLPMRPKVWPDSSIQSGSSKVGRGQCSTKLSAILVELGPNLADSAGQGADVSRRCPRVWTHLSRIRLSSVGFGHESGQLAPDAAKFGRSRQRLMRVGQKSACIDRS